MPKEKAASKGARVTKRSSTRTTKATSKRGVRAKRRAGRMPKAKSTLKKGVKSASYNHSTAEVLLRPDVGTQTQFKKHKPPTKYRLRFVALACAQLGRSE